MASMTRGRTSTLSQPQRQAPNHRVDYREDAGLVDLDVGESAVVASRESAHRLVVVGSEGELAGAVAGALDQRRQAAGRQLHGISGAALAQDRRRDDGDVDRDHARAARLQAREQRLDLRQHLGRLANDEVLAADLDGVEPVGPGVLGDVRPDEFDEGLAREADAGGNGALVGEEETAAGAPWHRVVVQA
jgi:hypothetical protein